jgi:hypothetical protein
VLAGAGKSLIDRSNGRTFVIGSMQQCPTKIHLGNVRLRTPHQRLTMAVTFSSTRTCPKFMPALRENEFSHLVLNGTAVGAAWVQLFQRYAAILEHAIEQKRTGRGLFARPEADLALLGLAAVMYAIDPSKDWLESGMATLATSLQHALLHAPDVYWDREWLGPLDMQRFIPFEEYNSAALLCEPRTTDAIQREVVRFLISAGKKKPAPKLDRRQKQRRRRLYDLLQAQGAIVQRYMARPDRSLPQMTPDSSIVVSDEFGPPLWTNGRIPPFPVRGVKEFRQFGQVLMGRLHNYQWDAWYALKRLPMLLGLELLPEGYEEYPLPRTKWWNDCASEDPTAAASLEWAILDRLLGASADEFLSACLAASRLAACVTRWTLPHAPAWLHVVDWEIALVSCMIGDDYSANVWLTHLPLQRRHEPAANLACEEVLASWISDRRWPSRLAVPRLINGFQKGFLTAMQGICEGSPKLASHGVRDLMKAYHRVDYRPAEGRGRIPWMCLQAVALERIARKTGLEIDVSPLEPNDAELFEAKDPVRAYDRWSIHPGVELVTNSPQEFAWPALYLNKPVESADDAPVGDES